MSDLLSRRERIGMILRSLAVQGSWNYETLIGTGFAFTLLPALRTIYRNDPDQLEQALARHGAVFNSHPYLATVAAGAVARLEADGTDPILVQRFKDALRGSLGSLGDRLVWMAWRPTAVLLGLVLLLLGAPWWIAVAVFLVVYNALHLALRVWGLRIGLANGLQVASVLRNAPLQPLATRAADAGALLAGLAVALFIGAGSADPMRIMAIVVGTGLGLGLGMRARAVAAVAFVATWLVSLALGSIL